MSIPGLRSKESIFPIGSDRHGLLINWDDKKSHSNQSSTRGGGSIDNEKNLRNEKKKKI